MVDNKLPYTRKNKNLDSQVLSNQIGILTNASGVIVESFPIITPETDDTARIQRALDYANTNNKGFVIFDAKTYNTSATLNTYIGLSLLGKGTDLTKIIHSGNNACIQLYASSVSINRRSGIFNLSIIGSGSNASAIGIEIADVIGFEFHKVEVRNFTSGIGVLLHNRNSWTEATIMQDLHILNCQTSLQFKRTNGTDSFAYTRIFNLLINVPINGVGIDFGGTTGNALYIYNIIIQAAIWLDNNSGATGIIARTGLNFEKSKLFIVGEGGTGSNTGIKFEGGTIKGTGFVRIAGATNSGSSGFIRIVPSDGLMDTMSGVDGSGNSYKMFMTQNIDDDAGASFGYYSQSNIGSPYATMYDYAGNKFSIRRTSYGQKVSQSTEIAYIDSYGVIYPQTHISGNKPGIFSGNGSPDGVLTANPGSVYLRRDGGEGTAVYIKNTGTGNTGWAPIIRNSQGVTGSRPTGTLPTGFQYYDTTLGKPVWWNGSAWKDAMGTTV